MIMLGQRHICYGGKTECAFCSIWVFDDRCYLKAHLPARFV